MKKEEENILLKTRIMSELDFIVNSRFSNSLKLIMNRYPEGVPEHIIAKSLMLAPSEISVLHKTALKILGESIAL